ncbi:hypothetical protein BN444_03211 [Xanthomonas translucens pv. translucens DSM 18974]|uniref:Uncharacterized protein n=1 Tax=Xanthomonas translucens pv. translucens DSM 18974 TaxID=1261556 RepID=A0A1C3TRV2_XANCT|nr:hypothetical protein BN444_03211 [Xanthomonas translucens pv. translucens DSM 18974]SCB05860.1 hypothetical protein BN444_03211 [Xanthomonas translucens pv. translucens DSM 18974]
MAYLIRSLSIENLQGMAEVWRDCKNKLPNFSFSINQRNTTFVVNTNYIIDVRAISKCHWFTLKFLL